MTDILAAVIGALIGGALSAFITYRVAYPLGVKQGKEQLRHEESVRVPTEIRAQLLKVRDEFADWVHDLPSKESDQSRRTMELIGDLQKYYEENRVVLGDDTRSEVEGILESLEKRRDRLMLDLSMANLGNDEEKQRNERYRAGAETRAWLGDVLPRRLEEFEKRLARTSASSPAGRMALAGPRTTPRRREDDVVLRFYAPPRASTTAHIHAPPQQLVTTTMLGSGLTAFSEVPRSDSCGNLHSNFGECEPSTHSCE